MYRRIAVVMDGSEESLSAAKEACGLARVHGSESVSLIMVLPERKLLKAVEKAAKEQGRFSPQVMAAAAAELDEAGIANETVLLGGKLADEVGRYARESEIELLVVGSKAFQKVVRAVRGQRGEARDEHRLGCPVMVVKGRTQTVPGTRLEATDGKDDAREDACHV